MYSGIENPQLDLDLLQQLRLGTEVFLPLARACVVSNTIAAGSVVNMAKWKSFPIVCSLAGALPRSDVMDLCRCIAQLQVATNHAAQLGHAGKIFTFCLSHAGPPAEKAKHRYRMSSAEGVKMFYAPSESPVWRSMFARCSGLLAEFYPVAQAFSIKLSKSLVVPTISPSISGIKFIPRGE